jgi:hypothetical protein
MGRLAKKSNQHEQQSLLKQAEAAGDCEHGFVDLVAASDRSRRAVACSGEARRRCPQRPSGRGRGRSPVDLPTGNLGLDPASTEVPAVLVAVLATVRGGSLRPST